MSYVIHYGSRRISIGFETRNHNNYPSVKYTEIATFSINHMDKNYDSTLKQADEIVNELNKLDEQINHLKQDLIMCQTPALFNLIESEKINSLKKQLSDKDYEVNHLIDSIYRKTDEFYEEKKKLLLENNALRKENKQSAAMVEAVRKTELGKIPTDELAQELYNRMINFDKLERSHEKLLVKHKTAANMIADLKK